MASSKRTTMLALIQGIQDTARTDEEVVATVSDLVNSGRVVLSGSSPVSASTTARDWPDL